MERVSRFRARMLLLLFSLVLAFFIYTMYDLQVVETGGVIDNTTTLPPSPGSKPPGVTFWTATVTSWWVTVPATT